MRSKRDYSIKELLKSYTKKVDIITEANAIRVIEKYAASYFNKRINKKTEQDIIDVIKYAIKKHSNSRNKEIVYKYMASFILQYFKDDANSVILLKKVKNEKDKNNKS
jgi:hypothetical protein